MDNEYDKEVKDVAVKGLKGCALGALPGAIVGTGVGATAAGVGAVPGTFLGAAVGCVGGALIGVAVNMNEVQAPRLEGESRKIPRSL
jgi:outer membrane lipoprotein SlyB